VAKLAGEAKVEEMKTPGGRGAGQAELYYCKTCKAITVKPKGGAGPGEDTGFTTDQIRK
jgi:hypothetical protein